MIGELLRERYEPLDVIGRGGEGEVIRALDHLHGRQVALKVRPVGDEASRAALLSEARVLLSLAPHPGLPLVREDFFADDRYVIAMDWIEGTDLEALLLRDGTPGLEPALAIGYLEQAAEALEHLHAQDPPVVHGDVKPANLILTSTGRVVLVDFGLSSTPTAEQRRAGTAGFVAPEVGAGARPTAAADVYSLAATALALLTGERPSGGPPGWGSLEPERIPALERIVRRNLATDRERRDRSAASFVAALARWWGADLPRGTVTLVLADVGGPTRDADASVDEVARAHGGHSVSPSDDGPVLAAFPSARESLDAARDLAARLDARVAAVTGDAEPVAGSYRGEPATSAARLLGLAEPGQVLIDDPTADSIDGRLPPELGLAEIGDASPRRWVLVAPGLSIPPRAATCPYRGLMAFRPEDGDLFFGREEVVASILERLLQSKFMAVVGASGSGKSSLVRAGLVPAFRQARSASAVVMAPGPDPAAELEHALAGGPPSLLVVDQLEEVFTLCPDEAGRTRFLDALLDLHDAGSTAVAVALRADFYGRCANHPRLAAAVAAHQHLLGPMRTDELRRAIELPARAAGLRLEHGLIDAMVTDVEGEPGALPLLSHALYESWARREGRVLTLAGYRAAGGVRGAIAHTAEEVYLGCTPREQALVRQMLLRLTELGEGTEDTRRRVPLAELAPEGDDVEAEEALERLAASRLLVVGDDSAEIAHEALIREWPRLRGWLAEDREELRTRRQLATAARSWEESGRDDADLYRGARLEAAVEGTGDGRRLSRVEREFLDASRGAQERELVAAQRRARRLRVLLAVVAAALVAAVIAGAFALVQRGSARHTATVAEAGRLAAQSREIAAEQPDLGLLLALEAGNLDDSVDSRSALLGALEHGSRIRAWLQGFDAPVNAAAFSPDGTLLATATLNEATVWDTATWRPAGPPVGSDQGGWSGVDFSPDGRTLALAGGEGRVELWDVAAGRKLRELADPAAASFPEPALSAVVFSPDGAVVAAGGLEANHVTLWDAASGRMLGRPITTNPPGTGGAHSISFSPDSKRIAVPGAGGAVGIWDVATGRRVGRPLVVGDSDVEAAIFADDGRTLIASDDSGAVSTLDVESGRVIGSPLSVGNQVADSLDLSPDGRLLAAASFDGSVFVWDRQTGTVLGTPLRADASPVGDVVFSPDGRNLVTSHLRSAVVWDMSGGHAIGAPLGRPGDVTEVAFSPDGRWLVAGQLDGETTVYDATTRQVVRRIDGDSVVSAVAVHPDGKLVAVGTVDGSVRLLDRGTGVAALAPLDVGSGAVWQVAFSPDGRLLAVALDPNGAGEGFFTQQHQGEVQLWDAESRRRVGRAIVPGAGSVFSVAFSPDGTLLATGSGGRLDLWDVATQGRRGRPMRVADDGVLGVAFDPSGKLVAAGGAIGPVRVWRVEDGSPAFPPLSGHTGGYVTGTAFDPAGSLLATTSLFGGTRLWDPSTGLPYGDELVSPWPESVEPTIDLAALPLRNAFSPDGKLLATAGVEAHAMVWEVDPAVWRRRACAIAGRNLSREEWRLYLPAGTAYRPTCQEWPGG
jgi:WD40 repeat protein/tRNA A-37 threonylcarbamoyl transferase component Bud32